MLNSGLPLLKSLGVLAERLPPKTAQLCLGIERDLKMGTSFAGCINNRQEVWGALPAAVAEAGENGGILCEMLEELAEYYILKIYLCIRSFFFQLHWQRQFYLLCRFCRCLKICIFQ